MVKKLLISILVLLAIGVAATGPARAQNPQQRTLTGIPQGWTVTADGQSVTVNNNTAIITDGSEVILTPTTAEINFVKGVTLTDAPMPVIGNFILLDTLTRDYVMQDNDTLTGTLAGNYKISVAENATVTLYNVTINGAHDNNCKWAGITCLGDATINLIGTNIVRGFWAAYPAIQVGPDGTTLTIQGEGSLDAICNVFFYDYGSDYGSAAGIGSYYGGQSIVCGNIVILSGNIISKGGRGCPGIGSSKGTTCGDITISGGNVTAIGGASSAAIGCGEYFPSPASCGNILINGGTVMAIDTLGVGIGVGADEDNTYLGHNHCGTITITDDVTQVTAIGLWYPIGKYSNHDNSYLGAITIGGTVYWTGSAYSSYEHYQYIIQDTIVYPVQDLYIHYDNGTWPAGIESSHFTSNGDLKIACEPSYSISMIKNRIAKQTGFAESVMMLSYTGNVILADNQTLADYNIQKGSVITLTYEDSTIPVKQANGAWKFTMPDYNAQVDVEYYNGYVLTLACNGSGVVVFSGDTLPQGVTAVPGSTANTYYVVSGTEVTVKARANENYGFESWTNENSNVMGTDSTLTITITGDTTLTANFVRDFEGSGTEDDPYIISNTEKWTLLSNRVKEGKGYYGKYFLQTDSIFAGRIYVGTYYSATSYSPFGGIYDGGGHALEFLDNNISSMNKANRAPFICVDGATIRNLHITGTIKTYYNFIAGFIARTVTNNRTTTIINCRSSIRIESLRLTDYDGTHGGFVAVTDAAVNFIGCVFDGALIGAKTRSSGGFIGWTEKNASVNFIDCIFAPDSLSMGDSLSCTFSRARKDTSLHFTNCYYAQAFGKEQGKKLRSITAGADVTTLGLAGTATVYNVSGITAYADNNGLKYGDMFFAGDTDVVNLTLGHADRSAEGMIFDSYSASNGASFNGDTLTMPNDSTVISANYFQCPMLTLASNGNGTMGFCGDTLPQGVTPGSTANTYYVVSGTEVCIKATPAEHNYMQKWNNEAALNSNEAVNTSFTVTKDTILTAYFVQKPILTLGTNPSNPVRGTVTIAGTTLPSNVEQIGTSSSYYVDYGTNVTVVATPIAHYHLASWSNIGGNELEQVVTMTQDMGITGVFAIDTFTLTLKTNDINMGTVEVTNHNGNPAIVSHDPDANGTRTYKVNYGAEVIIKATPKEHYHLDSWSNGVTVNTDDTIHVIVTTDSTIMATFDTNTYVLNVVSADAAMGSVSGSNPAAKHFLSYEISATPNNGCHFVQWNDGNTDNPRTVTLSSDSTFTATFAATPAELAWSTNTFTGYTYIDFNNYKPTLTNPHNVSVRYGCVEGNQSLYGGILCDAQTGTIGASSPVYGYIHGVAGTYHIYAVHETDQTYYYDSVVYTLHVLPSAQVSLTKNIADGGVVSMPDYTDESTLTHLYITVNGTSYAYVAQGYSMNIMAEPATGYHFSKWTLDQSDLSTNAAYTYQAPATITGNLLLQYIQAVFDTNTYVLNVVSADAAMGSVSGSNPAAKHFLSYEISATPNNGCHFVQWNDGNTDNPRTVTLSSDSTFTATFAATPAELAWSTNTFTGYAYIDFNNYKPTLTNPHNVSVRYGLAENVNSVKVNQETGYITNSFNVPVIYTQGTYHIYAVHETDQTYYYDSVVYTLNVNRAALVRILRNIEEGGSNAFLNADADLTHAYSSSNNSMIAYLAPGAGFTVEATANEGYHFSKWQTGNNEDGYTDYATTSTVVYTAPATITSMSTIGLKSVFDTNTYVLNVQSADAAMGSVSGSNPAAKHFLSYEISAIPGPDYRFERWNDGNTNNPRTVTITSDSNFTAYFAPNSYTITYMDGQTELNVDTFDYRQPIREYTTSKQGWNFEGWNPEVPQLMPAENLVVYAQWSRICDPVTDVDHNTYPTVGIGNICWMAENLRTTHYADGREITHIYEYQNEMYPNVQENVSIYGRLYDWYDAADSARPTRAVRVQGICPDGWYLPNEEDFELLNNVNLTNLRSVNYWLFNPGTNTTGYDLRPAGMYNFATSRYEDLHGYAYLWSVTSISSVEAHCHMADCNCYMLVDLIYNKNNAFSVRCVKD